LVRILDDHHVAPCRTLEIGCGTGTNAIYLAERGFSITAVDLSSLAIETAKKKLAETDVKVDFRQADLAEDPDVGGPFDFVFDRGVYHTVRGDHLRALLGLLGRVTNPSALYVVLAGNANEKYEYEMGPPQVRAEEICAELSPLFDLVSLSECRFDGVVVEGKPVEPLAWAGVFRRRG
jgi:cyclopropane fatty-acyl-phospholipid synthase-like methyltransferase